MDININNDNIDTSALRNEPPEEEPDDGLMMNDPAAELSPEMVAALQPQKIAYDDKNDKYIHRSLIMQLRNYQNSSFGRSGVLAEYDFTKLEYKTIEELQLMLEDVKFSVSASSGTMFTSQMFSQVLYGFEKSVTRSGLLDLTGITQNVLLTPNIDKYIEELALEYQQFTYTKPIYKIGYIVASKAMFINEVNESKKMTQEKLKQPVNDDIAEKFSDL